MSSSVAPDIEEGISHGRAASRLNYDDWRRLGDSSPSQPYPPFTNILTQGFAVQDVFFIERGIIKLSRVEEHGREFITGLRFPSSIIGAAPVILERPSPATAITLTTCYLSRITPRSFVRLLQENTYFSWQLHLMHSRELFEQTAQVSSLVWLSARLRLECLLSELISEMEIVEKQPKAPWVPLRQLEIAQLIAVTPQYLCELLKEMEQENVIQRRKGRILILDPLKLRRRPES